MRVRLMCVLMILAVFVTGCSSAAEASADRVREHYAEQTEAVYNVTLRTDFGDRVQDFSLEYVRKPDRGHMKVTAPEIIAGIEAELLGNGVTLHYDGTVLELGALPGTGLSPMESLPFIVSQWANGYITQSSIEQRGSRTLLRLTTRVTQGETTLDTTTWFDTGTLKPVNAELAVNGLLTVSVFFEE